DSCVETGDSAEAGRLHGAALTEGDAVQLRTGLNECFDKAAAARVEAGTLHAQRDVQSANREVAPPGDVEKMKAGAGVYMRAADQRQGTGLGSAQCERQIDGVQHEAGRAGGADVEAIGSCLDLTRLEDEIGAAARGAAQLSAADRCGGADAHQVLRL